MTPAQIMAMQQRIKDRYDPFLKADGFWGPKSQAACRAYLRSLMPKPNPWPESRSLALQRFYGMPGDESQLVRIELPYPKQLPRFSVPSQRIPILSVLTWRRLANLQAARSLLPSSMPT